MIACINNFCSFTYLVGLVLEVQPLFHIEILTNNFHCTFPFFSILMKATHLWFLPYLCQMLLTFCVRINIPQCFILIFCRLKPLKSYTNGRRHLRVPWPRHRVLLLLWVKMASSIRISLTLQLLLLHPILQKSVCAALPILSLSFCVFIFGKGAFFAIDTLINVSLCVCVSLFIMQCYVTSLFSNFLWSYPFL